MTAETAPGKLLVCNCQRTMDIDGDRLARALGLSKALTVHRELCRSETGAFTSALAGAGPVQVACTQEAALFRELADESGADPGRLRVVNIRERAGWTADKGDTAPKIAALIAEAGFAAKPAGALTLKSEGVCLVYGRGQAALDAAAALNGRLSPTLLLTHASDALPGGGGEVPIFTGRIRRLSGHLGAFEVEVDGYAALLPSSRRRLEFAMPRDGARSKCDLVLDLSGGPALLSEADRRDGYLRVDPDNPTALAKALLRITDLVGEFEKPLYVSYDPGICAYARSGKVGCRNCLDVCPMGAITPAGDKIAVDHYACAGCGNCSAVCPTGAVSQAMPGREDLIGRVGTMLATYRDAGGRSPVLLVHEAGHGGDLIAAMARFGRGLPAHVLPVETGAVTGLGHEALAAFLAAGAGSVVTLVPPSRRAEQGAIETQSAMVEHILAGLGFAGPRLRVVGEMDPDVLEALLWDEVRPLAPAAARPPIRHGTKREFAREALATLHAAAPAPVDCLALPVGAPYGRITVDSASCTLCLACVGACPANALSDNADRPELGFTESACVQCGICVATCPESAIALEPRFDFTKAALDIQVLKSEEPFACTSCGKPFGTRSSIERVVERLKNHAMFRNEKQVALIQMCDRCRVVAMAEAGGDPLAVGGRPRIRTTDDYIEARAEAARTGRKPEDFLDD